MKIKVVVVDLELPPRVKRLAVLVGIPLAVVVGSGTVAWAANVHTWNDGDTLSAADLNGNFNAIQSDVASVRSTVQAQTHASSAFRAHLAMGTTIQSDTTTSVVFDDAKFDLAAEYNKTTGVFTPKQAGTYLIECQLELQAQSGWRMATFLQRNAVDIGGATGTPPAREASPRRHR